MKTLNRILTTVLLILAAPGTAHAQKSWNVTSGLWNTGSNWSPAAVPVAGDAVVIANGGTASLDTTSVSGLTSLTIGSTSLLQKDNSGTGRTLTGTATSGLITNSGTIWYGQGGNGVFAIRSGSSGWNNSGLITADVASRMLSIETNAAGVDIVNTGTIQANSGTMRFTSGGTSFDFINAAGVVRAINNGTLQMTKGPRMTGGSVSIEAGSTWFHSSGNDSTDFTDVTVVNAGRMYFDQTSSNRMNFNIFGSTSFTNSGTFEVLASSTGTLNPNIYATTSATSTITNQATGIIRIALNMTAGSGTAYFQNSTSNFTNAGRIEIFSNLGLTAGSSQFRSSGVNLSNAGSFLVDGPISSIEMGARTFTQTAGALSLVNGGRMTAGSVLINSGTLLGTGTINAPVTIGGILAPGNAGIGTLSVTNGVTWNAGNAWLFTLGTPAVSLAAADTGSNADLLSLTGAFTQGTGGPFTFDFATSGSDGWYKLVDYASTTFTEGTNTDFAATNLPAGKTATFVVDPTTTALYVQIVPEPGAIALAGVGVVCAGLMYRKRRRDR